MAKINRFSGDVKAIASESQDGERYVFGSASVTSDDLTDQMTNAMLRGWATVGPSDFPPLEWFNAVAFTATQFNSYLHQMGVAEWDALQEYPTDGALVIHNGAQWSRSTGWVVGDEPGVASTWLKLGSVNAQVQVLTTSQTYTPPDNVRSVKVTLIGGGAGGGGVDGQGVGTVAIGGGGAGGGTSIKFISSLESSYSVTIGSGGAGGAAGDNDGTNGGTSTFIGDDTATTSMSSSGGNGGKGFLGSAASNSYQGAFSGIGTGGDINLSGDDAASVSSISRNAGQLGHSGGSYLGGQTRSPADNHVGFNANAYGSGGSGAFCINVSTDYAGGDGSQGVCIIEEYY